MQKRSKRSEKGAAVGVSYLGVCRRAGTRRDRSRFAEGGHDGQQAEEDETLGQRGGLPWAKVVVAADIRRSHSGRGGRR